jgi:hypothetical protein
MEGPTIKEKANEIALKLGIEFQCSNGWLQRFKRRNITWQAMSGEGSSVDTKVSDKWHENVTPIIKQYAPENIFNMDETALYLFTRLHQYFTKTHYRQVQGKRIG